jgi:dTMP kinase
VLIDIEGIDGSGKGTQARALVGRLAKAGISGSLVSFPRYEATLFGRAVGEFLNGEFGALDEVHPFLVSLLFAGDRFESRPFLLDAMRTNEIVVLDRYVPSNVAHQAAKLDGAARAELTRRILEIELGLFGLPKPDLVVLLDLPVSMAQRLIAKKGARAYTAKKADLQEADGQYLERVREVYLELARIESHWQQIACCEGNRLRSVDEIAEDVWQLVSRFRQSAPTDAT